MDEKKVCAHFVAQPQRQCHKQAMKDKKKTKWHYIFNDENVIKCVDVEVKIMHKTR